MPIHKYFFVEIKGGIFLVQTISAFLRRIVFFQHSVQVKM